MTGRVIIHNQEIGIVAKHNRQTAVSLAADLVSWCRQQGYSFCLSSGLKSGFEAFSFEKLKFSSIENIVKNCNPIVVLGGDGTLISVCHNSAETSPVIIGVNVGTLGFLTEIARDELFDTLEKTLCGKVELSERFLLYASVKRRGQELAEYYAFNDIVLTKGAIARIFSLKIKVNEKLAAVIRGDGVVVGTPSGSTAYSLSAGGSIVHPNVKAILVTPICPHSLSSRPLVLPGDFRLELIVDNDLPKEEHVFITADGQQGMALNSGDVVKVTTSDKSCLFVSSSVNSYFDVLGSKLKWSGHSAVVNSQD